MLMATTAPAATAATASSFENDLLGVLGALMGPDRAKKAIADGKVYAGVELKKIAVAKIGPAAIAIGAVSVLALGLSITAMFFPRRVR